MRTIFARKILRLYAAKIGAGNVIKKRFYDVSYKKHILTSGTVLSGFEKDFEVAAQGRKDMVIMGMRVGTDGAQRRVLTFQDISGSPVGTVSVSKSGSSKKKKKKNLNYNYREISGRILRAKKSVTAGQVVVSARSRVAILRRKAGTGDYNERELAAAIIHAERMLRVAKKKLKHLKEEEKAERHEIAMETDELEEEVYDGIDEMDEISDMEGLGESGGMSEEELRQLIAEMERQMQEAMEDMGGLEELSEDMMGGGAISPEELELWKKKHRAAELREITEADMKYLKAMFERFSQEQQDMACSVILELSSAPEPVAMCEAPVAAEGGGVDVSV